MCRPRSANEYPGIPRAKSTRATVTPNGRRSTGRCNQSIGCRRRGVLMDKGRPIRSEDVGKFIKRNPNAVEALRSAQRYLEGNPNSDDKLVRRNYYVALLRKIENLERTVAAAALKGITLNHGDLSRINGELARIARSGTDIERKD